MLLDIILSVSILGLVVTTCLPAWWSIHRHINTLSNQLRATQELNWMISRICDDSRFGIPNVSLQYDGTRVRRIVNGSTQILNTIPVIEWQAPSPSNGYQLRVKTQTRTRVCNCQPWRDSV